jgi:hypothetical protein
MNGRPLPKEVLDEITQQEKGWINPAVVTLLEGYLNSAKRGNVLSFGIAVVCSDGQNSQTYICAPNTNFQLHSSAAILEKKLARYVETGVAT